MQSSGGLYDTKRIFVKILAQRLQSWVQVAKLEPLTACQPECAGLGMAFKFARVMIFRHLEVKWRSIAAHCQRLAQAVGGPLDTH
jgi:hypothetical protein